MAVAQLPLSCRSHPIQPSPSQPPLDPRKSPRPSSLQPGKPDAGQTPVHHLSPLSSGGAWTVNVIAHILQVVSSHARSVSLSLPTCNGNFPPSRSIPHTQLHLSRRFCVPLKNQEQNLQPLLVLLYPQLQHPRLVSHYKAQPQRDARVLSLYPTNLPWVVNVGSAIVSRTIDTT